MSSPSLRDVVLLPEHPWQDAIAPFEHLWPHTCGRDDVSVALPGLDDADEICDVSGCPRCNALRVFLLGWHAGREHARREQTAKHGAVQRDASLKTDHLVLAVWLGHHFGKVDFRTLSKRFPVEHPELGHLHSIAHEGADVVVRRTVRGKDTDPIRGSKKTFARARRTAAASILGQLRAADRKRSK